MASRSVNGRRARGLTAVLVAVCTVLAADVAGAHDNLAPAGAAHNWLPEEPWVSHHWVPFDEQALKRALGLRGLDLHAYLYNDHHTLAELARRRGLDPQELAGRLVAPWRGIDESQRALLRDRTLRILTQGHLAQHMFFHVFHGLHLGESVSELFGMPLAQYQALRAEGLTYAEIMRRGGVPQARFREAFTRLVEHHREEGARLLEASPLQGRTHARTLAWLPCWMSRPTAGLDGKNPYGKNRLLHGRHTAGWPATARERRRDEGRVERFRSRLPASCWMRPPPWSWEAHGMRAP